MAETFDHESLPKPANLDEAHEVINMLREALAKTRMDVLIKTMLNKEETGKLIEAHVEEGQPFGILMIDLDNFKQVNDQLGHKRGDELLISLGLHLHENFRRETDEIGLMNMPTQGRVGGDEFMIVADLSRNDRRETNPHLQMDKIYDLARQAEADFLSDNPDVQGLGVGFSIGSAMYDPTRPVDAETLMEQADEAVYEEKKLDPKMKRALRATDRHGLYGMIA